MFVERIGKFNKNYLGLNFKIDDIKCLKESKKELKVKDNEGDAKNDRC